MIEKLVLLAFTCIALANAQLNDRDRWWKSANIYQLSTVSFKDSNNDGFGDIKGIISKLDYLVETGVDVIFLTPIYETPFKDFAYDISSYTKIDSRFGTIEDLMELFAQAKQKGLKVILDFVPNHTSNEHEWFINSENRVRGFENFYVWHDGVPNADNQPLPPNEWKSVYGGSSWTWSETRQAYYYHAFAEQQPDLNLREQRVLDELDKVLAFWLEKGADGFRVDAVSQLFEDAAFIGDPSTVNNLPQTYELVEKWRRLVDDYSTAENDHNRVLVPQVWESELEPLVNYYESGNGTKRAQLPTNFILINELDQASTAADYKSTIDKYLNALPTEAVANWFLGTHDHSRVASRMGSERVDGLTMLLLTLPGVAFTYNGDEIGMLDHREISWEDTTDPWACNANPIDYSDLSRDPARTPFQWDSSTNAGFNTGHQSWVPVHPTYTEINLQAQVNSASSHYKLYKELLKLRKSQAFVDGDFESKALTENVIAFSRSTADGAFVVLINLGNSTATVNVTELTVKLGEQSEILLKSSSSLSSTVVGSVVSSNEVTLYAFESMILKASNATRATLSLFAVVMLIVKLFS